MSEPVFCSQCGQRLRKQRIGHDPVERHCCEACGYVHYDNPVILVSCFAIWEGKALWMRRRTEPYAGLWAIPSGFMETGESPQEAAAREVLEETGARVDLHRMELHTVGTLVDINQVYLVFRAPLIAPEFGPTEEASEVALFSGAEVPYAQFAHPEVTENVELLYRELEAGRFGVHVGVLVRGENQVHEVQPEYP